MGSVYHTRQAPATGECCYVKATFWRGPDCARGRSISGTQCAHLFWRWAWHIRLLICHARPHIGLCTTLYATYGTSLDRVRMAYRGPNTP